MSKLAKSTRIDILTNWYSQYSSGIITREEITSLASKALGVYITESELSGSSKKYAQLTNDEFVQFLAEFNFIKSGKVRKSSMGGPTNKVNSVAKAESLGLSGDNINTYLGYTNKMSELRKAINELLPAEYEMRYYIHQKKEVSVS